IRGDRNSREVERRPEIEVTGVEVVAREEPLIVGQGGILPGRIVVVVEGGVIAPNVQNSGGTEGVDYVARNVQRVHDAAVVVGEDPGVVGGPVVILQGG